jgi:hypothetical protein
MPRAQGGPQSHYMPSQGTGCFGCAWPRASPMLGALCRHKLRGAAPAQPTPGGASRSSASSTYPRLSFEEQRQLHLPLPLETYGNGPELHFPSRDEWTRLREQADNAKARDLDWKPLSWLGTIRPTTANDAFDPALGRPFFSTTLGCVCACVPSLLDQLPVVVMISA